MQKAKIKADAAKKRAINKQMKAIRLYDARSEARMRKLKRDLKILK